MKAIGTIIGLYAAITLLGAPAALSDEPVSTEAVPEAAAPIDSLDSAIQRLSSGLPPLAAPAATSSTTPEPPVAVNVSSRTKAPPASAPSQPAQVAASNTPVLWVYEFSAKWCPSCRKLAPLVEEAAAKYNGFIQYVPVNVDKNQDLLRKLNIAQIPTVMVVDRTGRTLNRLVGLQQGAQIDTILDHYKAESMASLGVPQ